MRYDDPATFEDYLEGLAANPRAAKPKKTEGLTREAAKILNTSPRGVRWLIDAGLIPAKKVGSNLVIVPLEGLEKLDLTREDIVGIVRSKISQANRPQEGESHGSASAR
jgi:hypothetical protein